MEPVTIITERAGKVEYIDLIDSITLVERMDDVTGLTSKVVVDYKQVGKSIDLRPREFALLKYPMRNASRVVTKTMILSHVWDYSFDPQTNVVDVLVCRLRAKLDRDATVKLLHTERGFGYVLRGD